MVQDRAIVTTADQ